MYFFFVLLNRFWVMPAFVLKKMIMNNFTTQEVDEDIADSIDFMVERVSESFVFRSIYSSFNRNVTYFKNQEL